MICRVTGDHKRLALLGLRCGICDALEDGRKNPLLVDIQLQMSARLLRIEFLRPQRIMVVNHNAQELLVRLDARALGANISQQLESMPQRILARFRLQVCILDSALYYVSLPCELLALGRYFEQLQCHVDSIGAPKVVPKDMVLVRCVGHQVSGLGHHRNKRLIIHGLRNLQQMNVEVGIIAICRLGELPLFAEKIVDHESQCTPLGCHADKGGLFATNRSEVLEQRVLNAGV